MPKIRSRTAPLRRPGDSLEMSAAITYLKDKGVRFIRPTDFQLKIGHVNFYPNTGTIQLDGCKAAEERGLTALQKILDHMREKNEPFELDLSSLIGER